MMNGELSEREVAAILLIACGLVFTVGGILFTGRVIWKWSIGQTNKFLILERTFVIVALLMNVVGFTLLEDMLRDAGELILSRMALVIYLISVTVLVVAELAYLNNREWNYPQIVFHVITAFLGQVVFGVALLQTELVAEGVGWMTIIWNLGWLAILFLLHPKDTYYPALHHLAPLIIGIALLTN